MEFNFTTGIITGIIIAIIGMNILTPDENTQVNSSKYSTPVSYSDHNYSYDDGDNYESHGLHERGMH